MRTDIKRISIKTAKIGDMVCFPNSSQDFTIESIYKKSDKKIVVNDIFIFENKDYIFIKKGA